MKLNQGNGDLYKVLNVATNGMTNVTHLKVNTGAASWSSTSRNQGGKVPHIYSSERSKTRATHIQSCPGQPIIGKILFGFFTSHCRLNRVRNATTPAM